jgi:transposase
MRPGQVERRSHDYTRHGTTSLFAALDLATGKVIGQFHHRHRAIEFRKFLIRIDNEVPDSLEVHLILDNYATHKTAAIQRWLARHPRFRLHFTPTSASWLNLVERWFAELTQKQLQRGVHRSTRELENAIREFLEVSNEDPRPFVWTKSADEILESVAAFCKRTSNSGHSRAERQSHRPQPATGARNRRHQNRAPAACASWIGNSLRLHSQGQVRWHLLLRFARHRLRRLDRHLRVLVGERLDARRDLYVMGRVAR